MKMTFFRSSSERGFLGLTTVDACGTLFKISSAEPETTNSMISSVCLTVRVSCSTIGGGEGAVPQTDPIVGAWRVKASLSIRNKN